MTLTTERFASCFWQDFPFTSPTIPSQEYPDCGGSAQSPIDLSTSVYTPLAPAFLTLTNPVVPAPNRNFLNNGHTLLFTETQLQQKLIGWTLPVRVRMRVSASERIGWGCGQGLVIITLGVCGSERVGCWGFCVPVGICWDQRFHSSDRFPVKGIPFREEDTVRAGPTSSSCSEIWITRASLSLFP